jgi:hypothetical protein
MDEGENHFLQRKMADRNVKECERSFERGEARWSAEIPFRSGGVNMS